MCCVSALILSCPLEVLQEGPLTTHRQLTYMDNARLFFGQCSAIPFVTKCVNLVYKSQKNCLPPELTSRCGAFLHTLDLSNWQLLKSVSGLGQCGSLHTLNLQSRCELTDVSGLGQCGSLHTLDLSCCDGLTDVSGLGQCGSLNTLISVIGLG